MGFTPENRVRTYPPAEEDGFEPSVPLGREVLERSNISTGWVLLHGGTEGSNPSSSTGESVQNSPATFVGYELARLECATIAVPEPSRDRHSEVLRGRR